MATSNAEARSVDTFVRVGAPAIAAQPQPAAAVLRSSLGPITGAERRDANVMLAQYRPGGVAQPMRPIPVPPVRGGTVGGYVGGGYVGGGYVGGGYAGGYVATPSYAYPPSYGYAPSNGGLFGALFGSGSSAAVTIGPGGVTAGVQTGGAYYGQQQLAPADCIVMDGYGRQFAVRYGQTIPAGYQVVQYNPNFWTWWTTPNLY